MAIKYLNERKSARRVLLWMVIPTVLLQLVVNVIMDGPRPDLRSPHVARVLADIRATPPTVDVVCLGTSRFGMGIGPREIEKQLGEATGRSGTIVFNDAIPSGDYDTSDFLMKAMLRQGWRPGLVVIEVCPELVNRRNRIFGAHVMPPLTRQTVSTYFSDVLLSMNVRRLFVERLIPVYRYRRALWGEVARVLAKKRSARTVASERSSRSPGTAVKENPVTTAERRDAAPTSPRPAAEELFLDRDPSVDPRRMTEENLPRVRVWLEHYRVGGTASLGLERLIRRCRTHAIEVLLVAPPVASCQRAVYTPTIESVFVPYMHRLEQEYDCRFIDCRDSVPDKYFFDNHHLKAAGKGLFSRQLTRDAVIPIWHRLGRDHGSHATAKTSTSEK
jgi:hypothetical protein